MTTRDAAGRETLDPQHPLFGLGYAHSVERRSFTRVRDTDRTTEEAPVAEEVPVALAYNGKPHVVMMCTPADIEDFARGFTLTEEIVASASEIGAIKVVKYSQGIEVAISIPEARAARLADRGRALVGRTGCGLCGVTTIDDALRPGRHVCAQGDADREGVRDASGFAKLAVDALFAAADKLPAWQIYNDGTNAVHAAAWVDRAGTIVFAREDVGRHNALDKLIGAMSVAKLDPRAGFALVTSRASYELVQKCAAVGIVALAAISRPTGLAIRMADAAGIGLAGLVRGRSANLYAHPELFGA